jgi:FkbM family methyltransferase
MSLREWAIDNIPLRYQVPLRYWYRRVRRRLERELPIVCGLVPSDGVAIDVGANNGAYTYALSRLGTRVEAFEPVPACARNLEAFRSSNVRVHAVALSSRSGEREMFVPRAPGVTHTALASFSKPDGTSEAFRVPTRRLDEYAFTGVSFIKIDVEGHELEVVKGATETIAASHPLLLIEIEQRHLKVPMEDVFRELSNLRYAGFFLFDGRMNPIEAFSYKRHQEPFLDNVMADEYVNNFFFLHEQSPLRRRPNW